MATCAKWKVPIVITSLGAREELNQAVHGWGGITLHDVIDDRFARKAIEKGADGLIAVAAGAGGHAGRWSPFALVQEIRAGSTGRWPVGRDRQRRRDPRRAGDGRRPRLYRLALHRDDEANASDDYKQGIVEGRAADIVYSSLFTGVHGNYLRAVDREGRARPDNLPEGDLGGDELRRAAAPRRGATSGARARASARSTGCSRRRAGRALGEEYRAAKARALRLGGLRRAPTACRQPRQAVRPPGRAALGRRDRDVDETARPPRLRRARGEHAER
jgi:nitronate monooxygenase